LHRLAATFPEHSRWVDAGHSFGTPTDVSPQEQNLHIGTLDALGINTVVLDAACGGAKGLCEAEDGWPRLLSCMKKFHSK
jgi:hypothetical protein